MSANMDMVTVTAPASKSLSHRALIAAALSRGESVVEQALESVDIEITRRCLEAAGAVISGSGPLLRVSGFESGPLGGGQGQYPESQDPKGKSEPVSIFVNESGTSCRLLTAVMAVGQGTFKIHGAARMHERPIGELAKALEALGAKFTWLEKPGCPPFVLTASGLSGGEISLSLEESSQYLSGLLLAAPLARGTVTIGLSGRKAVSWPYVALTLKVMQDHRIDFEVQLPDGNGEWNPVPWRALKKAEPGRIRFVVRPGEYDATGYRVEGDWSNGSYFLAAGAVGPRPVRVEGLHADSLQGDRAILDILGQMGADIKTDFTGVTVSPAALRGVAVDMNRCPDLVPTVAVAAAFAQGETLISGVPHLRIKECDRLAAMRTQLALAGCDIQETEDGLRIHGNGADTLRSGRLELSAFGDHRIAMSLSLLAFAGLDVVLDDPDCVSKSYPDFWLDWTEVAPKGGRG
ncbi:MAG: 3-phosphoshikimate 1-carboxyvinyltransferase [Desulfovibrio sp.]